MCSKLKEILLSIFLISVSPSNNGTPYARFIGEHRANSAMSPQGYNLCRLHFLWPLICTFVLQGSCSWSCTLWKSSALVFPCCSFEVVLFSLRKFHVVLLRQLLKKQNYRMGVNPKGCDVYCKVILLPCLPFSLPSQKWRGGEPRFLLCSHRQGRLENWQDFLRNPYR